MTDAPDLFDAMTAERDDALALVAAAYEAAVGACVPHGDDDGLDRQCKAECADAICALTPADALAAQARRDERMRAEGMATAYAKAQQAIADLPYPKDEAAVNEQENCYRAVEALATLEKHHE